MCDSGVRFRWLGVAGLEIEAGGSVLLVDPFFTRPPWWRLVVGRVSCNAGLVAEHVQRADHVLVTHAHWDHAMDVPEVVRRTGATAWGPHNVCRLLELEGIPPGQIHRIAAGDGLQLGRFDVEVLAATHGRTPIDWLINGALPRTAAPPLRLTDYRMDRCLSFLITTAGIRFLHAPSERPTEARPADVLLVGPHREPGYYRVLLKIVRPRLVIPIHWDGLFRPLNAPLVPDFTLSWWSWPPLQRMEPQRFQRLIERLAPGVRVLIAERLHWYDVGCELGPVQPLDGREAQRPRP